VYLTIPHNLYFSIMHEVYLLDFMATGFLIF